MDQIHQYWQTLWSSHGTFCAPLSPVHLTVTSSNPTSLSNSLSIASNTCTDSPHLRTLLASSSRIAFVIDCPIKRIGMSLMLASRQWHHSGSLNISMIAFAESMIRILRFSNPINLQHLQHIFKLLSIEILAQDCPTTPNGFTSWMPIKNSYLFASLLTTLCSSTTNICVPSTTTSTQPCGVHSLW